MREPLSLMAYPTPVRACVRLSFLMPARDRVHLAIYDAQGRRVRTLEDGFVEAGVRTVGWAGDDDDGRAMPSGFYFGKLITPSASRTIRMVLTR